MKHPSTIEAEVRERLEKGHKIMPSIFSELKIAQQFSEYNTIKVMLKCNDFDQNTQYILKVIQRKLLLQLQSQILEYFILELGSKSEVVLDLWKKVNSGENLVG